MTAAPPGSRGAARLEGRAVLVTGAAQGIGRATAELLVAEGARVLLCDVDVERCEALRDELVAGGGEVRFVRTDVTSEEEVAAAVAAAVSAFGRLDAAVNNAAVIADHRPLAEARLEEFRRVLSVDLEGVFLCLKHELAQLLAQGNGGSIVNVASVNGQRARPMAVAYNAAKHGVIGLTRTAAVENVRHGIRVNAVCPGATLTPMMVAAMERRGVDPDEHAATLSPMGRFARPDEIAEGIVWLCSPASSYVTGELLAVDGGYLAT